MKVLVHYPTLYEPPSGIWWLPSSKARFPMAYYVDDKYKMLAAAVLTSKLPLTTWDKFFDQLSERTPYFTNFEVMESNENPEKLLDTLRRVAGTYLARM